MTNSQLSCPACLSMATSPHYKGLIRCEACGFFWANLEFSAETFAELYSRNYFFGGEYVNYLEDENVLRKDFKRNLDLLLPHCFSGRLLEFGCAYGFFLDLAKPFFSEVRGVEFNSDACRYAREKFGLSVECGDFLEVPVQEGAYDVATSWATIEHLPEPQRIFEKAQRLLKPGGIFAFTTGDAGTWLPRLRKEKWRLIHPPTHVSYFTKKSIEALLSRNGFEMVYHAYVGSHRSVNNVVYGILALIYKREGIYRFLKRLGLLRGSFYLNTYDTIYVVARKVKS